MPLAPHRTLLVKTVAAVFVLLCVLQLHSSAQSPSAPDTNPTEPAKLTCGGFPPRPGKEPDFGRYITKLQRKILHQWKPPGSPVSYKIVAVFRIDCAGHLSSLKLTTSSIHETANEAALKAITQSAPFKPLPSEYAGTSIPVQFTFDYSLNNQAFYIPKK